VGTIGEEDEKQDVQHHEEEKKEEEKASMQLDEEKGIVATGVGHQEEVEYDEKEEKEGEVDEVSMQLDKPQEEEEEEEEGVAGLLSEAEPSTALVVADDKTTDEYEDGEGEKPSMEKTDEGDEGHLSGEKGCKLG